MKRQGKSVLETFFTPGLGPRLGGNRTGLWKFGAVDLSEPPRVVLSLGVEGIPLGHRLVSDRP